jgi:hypothetical protein
MAVAATRQPWLGVRSSPSPPVDIRRAFIAAQANTLGGVRSATALVASAGLQPLVSKVVDYTVEKASGRDRIGSARAS